MKLDLSVVIPMYNEAQSAARITHEVMAALAGRAFEVILVDDGSTDATLAESLRLGAATTQVRVLQHYLRRGQSAAVCSGVLAARAPWVVTLDGDCQNDPRDIPCLIDARPAGQDETVQPVMGHRLRRRDSHWRRVQSRVANLVRSCLLSDDTPDTGCGVKLFSRETFLRLPRFDHMHRFLPALFLREGARVISVSVHHRPRTAGRSKYGLLDRLGAGIVDLAGMMWLMRRRCPSTGVRERVLAGPLPGHHGRSTTRSPRWTAVFNAKNVPSGNQRFHGEGLGAQLTPPRLTCCRLGRSVVGNGCSVPPAGGTQS
ncbi:MAG: dolichol-phosphate mannosyltransferase [Gammaproteobacteria bacterium]|nr:dolichol-phosphate mannosyltransferase [Gammaproteobacteria bacterium]